LHEVAAIGHAPLASTVPPFPWNTWTAELELVTCPVTRKRKWLDWSDDRSPYACWLLALDCEADWFWWAESLAVCAP
jgi:hypothetical protein